MIISSFSAFRLIAVCVGFLVALPAFGATLKIATLSPEGSSWMLVLREASKKVEERTNGAVTFKFYPGGVMGDDKTVLRKMGLGQLHGAVLTAGGIAKAYPDITIYNLPMIFRDEAEVDYVRERLDAKLMTGLREEKFVGFGLAEVGFAYPMLQTPGTDVAEIRKRKVWTPDDDPASLAAFEAFDITPIPLPMADVLAGLQTGLINAIAAPPVGTIALQWHTQVEYALDLPLMYVYGLFAIAERPFGRLTPNQQAIVAEEFERAVAKVNASSRQGHVVAKAALGMQGIKWMTPTEQSQQQWRDLAAAARERTVSNGYITQELFDELVGYLDEFRASGQ
jgi:TRAP-type C4-dicarboxylate transport system substrate-binding protein